MTRERLLKSPAYWVANIQIALYKCAEKFMTKNRMNRSQLAKHLGVSNGYVSQLLNGDYDHKLSKIVDLALAFGYVPEVKFIPIDEVVETDKISSCSFKISHIISIETPNYKQVATEKPLNIHSINAFTTLHENTNFKFSA